MLLPAIVSAKTSLGLGHGAVVPMRTVMYEIRNELKMNVSESRKIHIIALPHGTFLNARWSDDQSATTPSIPGASGSASPVPVAADCVMSARSSLTMAIQQHCEQCRPHHEQEVPIHGAQLDAQSNLGEFGAAHGAHRRPRPDRQTAEQVNAVHRGEQQEEGVRRIGRGELP